jgi:hypothetical protein
VETRRATTLRSFIAIRLVKALNSAGVFDRQVVQTLSFTDLKIRLRRAGHRIIGTSPGRLRVAISPTAETIITLAVESDPVVRNEYRDRFFISRPEPEAVIASAGAADYVADKWIEILLNMREPWQCAILAGPIAWVIGRLSLYTRIIMWSLSDECASAIESDIDRLTFRHVSIMKRAGPVLRGSVSDDGSAFVLSGDLLLLCDVVAASCLLSCDSSVDHFFADDECREVYMIHRHGKVILSVPDANLRCDILLSLRRDPGIYDDISDYE